MIFQSRLPQFLPALQPLTKLDSLDKKMLLTNSFLIEKEKELTMYYAPHNEYINTDARVVIIGITPGWSQMKAAFNQVLGFLDKSNNEEEILKQAKIAASFSGQMRSNLITMLDQCGLAEELGLKTTEQLFTTSRSLLHTTSVIRYPVFYHGKNYTGHTPTVNKSAMLKHYAYEIFPEELKTLKEAALIIPLGKVAEHIIHSVWDDFGENHTYLDGFPHPSGANGHRWKQFKQNYSSLCSVVKKWGSN